MLLKLLQNKLHCWKSAANSPVILSFLKTAGNLILFWMHCDHIIVKINLNSGYVITIFKNNAVLSGIAVIFNSVYYYFIYIWFFLLNLLKLIKTNNIIKNIANLGKTDWLWYIHTVILHHFILFVAVFVDFK